MEYEITGTGAVLRADDDFDPERIFECGQCFRWNSDGAGVYTGVAMGRAASVSAEDGLIVFTCAPGDFEAVWYDYFDLGRDYSAIRRGLCIDAYMKAASDFGAGIRILRQDRWEALCSFIISQCNNIKRIKGIVEKLCSMYGEPFESAGRTYNAFPSAGVLASLRPEDLAPLRCGYRAPYIINAAREVDSGRLDLDALASGSPENALSALKSLSGVGDKVANCAVLFGLQMLDAFPVDVWMKKALARHYGSGFDPSVFSPYAGIAQQYMFYYARSGKDCD